MSLSIAQKSKQVKVDSAYMRRLSECDWWLCGLYLVLEKKSL